jgi:hypothetical protein
MWFGIYPISGFIAYAALAFAKPLRTCPACAKKTKAPASLCAHCGQAFDVVELSTAAAAAAPSIPAATADAVATAGADAPPTPLFLRIPVARLILMSILSFGVYEAYWIYRNWRYVKERDHLDIRPFWRGVFCVLFCHSLLRRMHEDQEARAILAPSFSPNALATGWVVLIITANLVARAPSLAASMISAFIPSFLCLVPVQNYVNRVTDRGSPAEGYYRWSSGHVVCLVLGIGVWALLGIALATE